MSEEIETGVSHIAYFRTDSGSSKLYTQEYVDDLQNQLQQKDKEIERLNNIINELEHDFESYELEYLQDTYQGSLADFIETELEKLQELKGDDSNEL